MKTLELGELFRRFQSAWGKALPAALGAAIICLAASSGLAQRRNAAGATAAALRQRTATAPIPAALGEDWSTPRLPKSGLRAQPPLVAEKTERDTFTREIVAAQWRVGDPIYLYIIKPKNVTNPPVVLYLYSYPTTTKRFLDDSYCRRITARGCAAVGFDTALTGDRYRNRPMREWFVSQLDEALAASTHDAQMVLNTLASRGDMDMEHVGIFGQGSGAAIAVLAAGVDPRIRALDLVSPWGDWRNWLAGSALIPAVERPAYAKPEFQKRLASLEPLDWLPRLKGVLLRIQLVADYADSPLQCQERLVAAASAGTKIERYADSIAQWCATSGGRVFTWMSEQLNSTKK